MKDSVVKEKSVLQKVVKKRERKFKKKLSQQTIDKLETEELLQYASKFWLPQIKHPDNIREWILPNTKLTKTQAWREIWLSEVDIINIDTKLNRAEPWLLSEFRAEYKKELRNKIKDWAEDYLGTIFAKDSNIYIDADKKARLALDILKATEKEYNQQTGNQVNINLSELPLGEGLFEAQKKLVLELGITSDIFDNLE